MKKSRKRKTSGHAPEAMVAQIVFMLTSGVTLRLCVPAGMMRWWRLFLARFVPRRKRGEGVEEAYWPEWNTG